ncbi:hypothetical protein ApDm4_2410 [Acetobacter pomorum]|nr:hypothetical protein ApDm4_2410 [Acetobacter pomorum]
MTAYPIYHPETINNHHLNFYAAALFNFINLKIKILKSVILQCVGMEIMI